MNDSRTPKNAGIKNDPAYQAAYRAANLEKLKAAKAVYYENNRERIIEQSRLRYIKNREVISKKDAEKRRKRKADPLAAKKEAERRHGIYFAKRERILAQQHEHRLQNREGINARVKLRRSQPEAKVRLSEQQKKHYLAHKERRIKYIVEWRQKRYESDPLFAMVSRLRHRVREALRKHNNGVKVTTNSVAVRSLGCTIPELAKHIESLFQPGMTWDNRRLWHLDHVRPLDSFTDLNNPEQQKIAFHYKNLQPLWAVDNLKKHTKLLP